MTCMQSAVTKEALTEAASLARAAAPASTPLIQRGATQG